MHARASELLHLIADVYRIHERASLHFSYTRRALKVRVFRVLLVEGRDYDVEAVAGGGAVGKVACCRGDAEEGGVGFDFDSASVGHEFENSEPSVATVAFPASAEHLHVEHQDRKSVV